MNKIFGLILLLSLCGAVPQSIAQEKQQEKPKTEERAKPPIPVKIQVVLTENDGDKKISSLPYSFVAIVDDKLGGPYSTSTSLRTGVRVPIEIEGKDQKMQYLDVGSNIDCGVHIEDDGRYNVYLTFERSALYPNADSGAARPEVVPTAGHPIVRQFRSSERIILKDGQTSESVLSTDPLNGHVLRLSITLNVLK